MRKNRWTIRLALIVISAAAASSQADLAMPSPPISATQTNSVFAVPLDHRSVTLSWISNERSGVSPVYSSLPLGSQQNETGKDQAVKQIPAMPGSATLFLYMASGLGVYQLGRSVKSLNFGGLPDWYQTAGPRQIGHAHAVALSFNLLVMPTVLVSFDEPLPEPSLTRFVREESPRFCPQYFLSDRDVRGPPSLS